MKLLLQLERYPFVLKKELYECEIKLLSKFETFIKSFFENFSTNVGMPFTPGNRSFIETLLINLWNHKGTIKAFISNSFGYIGFLWILLYSACRQQNVILETLSLPIDKTVDRSSGETISRRER